MQKKTLVSIILLVLVGLTALTAAMRIFNPYPAADGPGAAGGAVAVIYLEGVITGGRGQGSLFGAAGGTDEVVRQLRQAKDDPDVGAVVLRINSPGGSAAASQEVYTEALRVREAGKPIVASFADVAASGGYWIACAADSIVANPASMTGSIGVIIEVTNVQELYNKLGIGSDVIKSGEHKDIASYTRPLEEKERRILQSMVDDIFDQFIDVVASGRGMSKEQVREVADGRVFTGRQALAAGLVDSLGDLADALDAAAELAGIPRPPRVKEMGRRTAWDILFGGNVTLQPSVWPLKPFGGGLLIPR